MLDRGCFPAKVHLNTLEEELKGTKREEAARRGTSSTSAGRKWRSKLVVGGLTRSSSWLNMSSHREFLNGISDSYYPPHHDYITWLRLLCSMGFRPHLLNSLDGLADPLEFRLIPSSVVAPSNNELNTLELLLTSSCDNGPGSNC